MKITILITVVIMTMMSCVGQSVEDKVRTMMTLIELDREHHELKFAVTAMILRDSIAKLKNKCAELNMSSRLNADLRKNTEYMYAKIYFKKIVLKDIPNKNVRNININKHIFKGLDRRRYYSVSYELRGSNKQWKKVTGALFPSNKTVYSWALGDVTNVLK